MQLVPNVELTFLLQNPFSFVFNSLFDFLFAKIFFQPLQLLPLRDFDLHVFHEVTGVSKHLHFTIAELFSLVLVHHGSLVYFLDVSHEVLLL